MQTSEELLHCAMHALRDLDAGYPPSDLWYPPGPYDEAIPGASGLGKLVAAIALHLANSGDLDRGARSAVIGLLPDLPIPMPSPADVAKTKRAAALRAIQEARISYADCVRALGGVDSNMNPYARAAIRLYAEGSDNDIEIDDTTMLSVGDDGAWVGAWLWVSNEKAGVHPWDDVLEEFRRNFQEFKQDSSIESLVSELVAKSGGAATQALLDLFEEHREAVKTTLSADAANACSDDDGEQDEAISAAEEFFEMRIDDSFASNIAVVLYSMGTAGEAAIRQALMPMVPVDFPVKPLNTAEEKSRAKTLATCGACGRSWDDGVATSWTPAPGARCPFEPFH